MAKEDYFRRDSEHHQPYAKHDLVDGNGRYSLNASSGLYLPKAYNETDEWQHETSDEQPPIRVNVSTNWKDWVGIGVAAIGLIISLGTLIAVIAYTFISNGQWHEMMHQNDIGAENLHSARRQYAHQIEDTKRAFELQIKEARLRNDADVEPRKDWFGWFGLAINKAISIEVDVLNYGTADASSVCIFAAVGFRSTRPPFGDHPGKCIPIDGANPMHQYRGGDVHILGGRIKKQRVVLTTAREYSAYMDGRTKLYGWGVIRFTDYWGEQVESPFCRYVTVRDAREITGEPTGTDKFHDCDEPETQEKGTQ